MSATHDLSDSDFPREEAPQPTPADLLAAMQSLASNTAEIAKAVAFVKAVAKATKVTGTERTVDGQTENTVTLAFPAPADALEFFAVTTALLPPRPGAVSDVVAEWLAQPIPDAPDKAPTP